MKNLPTPDEDWFEWRGMKFSRVVDEDKILAHYQIESGYWWAWTTLDLELQIPAVTYPRWWASWGSPEKPRYPPIDPMTVGVTEPMESPRRALERSLRELSQQRRGVTRLIDQRLDEVRAFNSSLDMMTRALYELALPGGT